MKYFFLSDGWTVGRVWESAGLWSEVAWRRKPDIEKMNVSILEQGEKLWLYRVEDAVLMVEVRPTESADLNHSTQAIGQVVLKRLITAEQVLEWLSSSSSVCTQKEAELDI